MHIQKITFDRVFSVHPKAWKNGQWTEFGFKADGLRVHDARVEGHPDVLEGVPLALALPRPDAWRKIYGWANLQTGEVIVLERHVGDIVVGIVLLVAFNLAQLPYVLSWAAVKPDVRWFLAVGALALNGYVLWGVFRSFRQFLAHKRLTAFVDAGR